MASCQLLACLLVVYSLCLSHIHSAAFNEDNFDEEALNILKSESRKRRAIGGEGVEKGDWPWLAHLYGKVPKTLLFGFIPMNYRHYYCGASLVSDRFILTAAHCIRQEGSDAPSVSRLMTGKYWHVTVGVVDPDKNIWDYLWSWLSGSKMEIHASKIIIHPQYNRNALWENDLAILKLEKAAKINQYSYPVELPDTTVINWPADDAEAVFKGWGCTESGGPGSDYAQSVILSIESESTCSSIYGNTYYVTVDKRMCAGQISSDVPAGICAGDSGGPLVVELDGNYVQAGIASFAISGAEGSLPGGFVRVSEYTQWIRDTIANS